MPSLSLDVNAFVWCLADKNCTATLPVFLQILAACERALDGICRATFASLAQRCGLSSATVSRAVDRLEQALIITREGSHLQLVPLGHDDVQRYCDAMRLAGYDRLLAPCREIEGVRWRQEWQADDVQEVYIAVGGGETVRRKKVKTVKIIKKISKNSSCASLSKSFLDRDKQKKKWAYKDTGMNSSPVFLSSVHKEEREILPVCYQKDVASVSNGVQVVVCDHESGEVVSGRGHKKDTRGDRASQTGWRQTVADQRASKSETDGTIPVWIYGYEKNPNDPLSCVANCKNATPSNTGKERTEVHTTRARVDAQARARREEKSCSTHARMREAMQLESPPYHEPESGAGRAEVTICEAQWRKEAMMGRVPLANYRFRHEDPEGVYDVLYEIEHLCAQIALEHGLKLERMKRLPFEPRKKTALMGRVKALGGREQTLAYIEWAMYRALESPGWLEQLGWNGADLYLLYAKAAVREYVQELEQVEHQKLLKEHKQQSAPPRTVGVHSALVSPEAATGSSHARPGTLEYYRGGPHRPLPVELLRQQDQEFIALFERPEFLRLPKDPHQGNALFAWLTRPAEEQGIAFMPWVYYMQDMRVRYAGILAYDHLQSRASGRCGCVACVQYRHRQAEADRLLLQPVSWRLLQALGETQVEDDFLDESDYLVQGMDPETRYYTLRDRQQMDAAARAWREDGIEGWHIARLNRPPI